MIRSVCIYCGSNDGSDPAYRDAAARLTALLAARRVGIVYGGGSRGLMGAVAEAALASGAPLTGVIPSRFARERAAAPPGATYLYVDSMQERKAKLRELSDAFIALPGGIGTLDEVAETLMLNSLGFHAKPLALLDLEGFFGPLMDMMGAMVRQGFMKPGLPAGIIVESDPEVLVERLLPSGGTR